MAKSCPVAAELFKNQKLIQMRDAPHFVFLVDPSRIFAFLPNDKSRVFFIGDFQYMPLNIVPTRWSSINDWFFPNCLSEGGHIIQIVPSEALAIAEKAGVALPHRKDLAASFLDACRDNRSVFG